MRQPTLPVVVIDRRNRDDHPRHRLDRRCRHRRDHRDRRPRPHRPQATDTEAPRRGEQPSRGDRGRNRDGRQTPGPRRRDRRQGARRRSRGRGQGRGGATTSGTRVDAHRVGGRTQGGARRAAQARRRSSTPTSSRRKHEADEVRTTPPTPQTDPTESPSTYHRRAATTPARTPRVPRPSPPWRGPRWPWLGSGTTRSAMAPADCDCAPIWHRHPCARCAGGAAGLTMTTRVLTRPRGRSAAAMGVVVERGLARCPRCVAVADYVLHRVGPQFACLRSRLQEVWRALPRGTRPGRAHVRRRSPSRTGCPTVHRIPPIASACWLGWPSPSPAEGRPLPASPLRCRRGLTRGRPR